MSHSSPTTRAMHARAARTAPLLAVVALLLALVPARAASSIEIEARALMGGRYEVGGWAAVAVTLVNEGEPTEGYLEAEGEDGVVRRFVEMPAGARKQVTLYVTPEAFQRRVTVRYDEPNGAVEVEVEVRVLEQTGDQVAIVGDGGGALRSQLPAANQLGSPEPITIGVADLPERLEPLRGLSGIIWAGDSAGLTEAQRRSLSSWIAEGGELVVVGGPDWQARTEAFVELLPIDTPTAVDAIPLANLAAWSGSGEAPVPDATVSSGTLRDDARDLVAADDGTLLVSMRSVGAGRVILVGADLASEPFRGWAAGPALWTRLLPSNAMYEQFFGGGMPPGQEMEGEMSTALSNLPSLEVPPAELLLLVIVGYILLIGPISYLVLRRLDRRELAWVSAPLLVLVFSACSYGIGTSMKGSDVIVNQIALIRTSAAGGAANVETYAGIFSPERATYDLRVDADALVSAVNASQFEGAPQSRPDVVVEQGDPARLRELAIGVFGFQAIRADAVTAHDPALTLEWTRDGDDLTGTVTNATDATIEDVAYISRSGGEMIGDLAAGETGTFEVGGVNFNASSASDQVYGFGGFDPADPELREVAVRRSVINALVGYGSFLPPGVDLPTSGRGPYLIGWHSEPGPLPITLEEIEAQQYAQSVEVIAVRPALGTGEITLKPAQLSTSITSTDGDVSSAGPGMVMIGEGSAIFSIALPLEAADMAVTAVEIVVGPDPGMVLSEQGGFGGGFWPPGLTIEVHNPQTGEWTMLGDLNERNEFEIADPATAVSPAGRIEVRITGTSVDQNFGQAGVFVGARISGVLDE